MRLFYLMLGVVLCSATVLGQACSTEYDPVCGTDGSTYPNECFARSAQVSIAHEGGCGSTCEITEKTPMECGPVKCGDKECGESEQCYYYKDSCGYGSYGCTYNADCVPNESQDDDSTDDQIACSAEYEPVCGTNGKSYTNKCQAEEVAGVDVAYEGTCREETACTKEYDPVCGTDGKTYGNACEASSNRAQIAYRGECGNEGGFCGDGICSEKTCKKVCNDEGECKEYCEQTCDADCAPREYCGDGQCSDYEEREYCKGDDYCPPCPDGAVCTPCRERICYKACPVDCEPKPACGNGLCEEGERKHCETYCEAYGSTATTASNSSADAEASVKSQCFEKCHDGCPQDCGKQPYCGDNVCDSTEQGVVCEVTVSGSQGEENCKPVCEADCGSNESGQDNECGDGICLKEELDSCAEDCSEVEATAALNVKSGCEDSCQHEDNCVPIGTRVSLDGKGVYCNLKASFEAQVADGSECQNDYECQSNTCSSGTCLNIQAELKEQRNILEVILDFLRNLFGFK